MGLYKTLNNTECKQKTFNTYCTEPDCKNVQIMYFFIVSEKNNRITDYSAQIKSKSGFSSEFDPQLTQKSSKVKLIWA
jgi:hypothetical protein